MHITRLLIFILVLTGSSQGFAQTTYQLVHSNDVDIIVDGQLTEPQWENATFVDLKWENAPVEGQPAQYRTHAWLFDDGDYLYVGFKAYDDEPNKIRAAFRDHDDLWHDDNVIVMVDTFNDERTGYQFYVNPLGAQADSRMTDYDAWQEDSSWNAIWDSAAKIIDDGYVVEIKIPLSTLRFSAVDNVQTWGVALYRNLPRETRYQMSNIKFNLDIKCSFCQFDKIVGFEQAKPGLNLQLTPTVTAIRSEQRDDNDDWQEVSQDIEPGLDIRYGITPDAVINATINPDFSQVEADSLQLDINETFALFYEEKRAFYLDGADYFKTEHLDLVHTRNIADPDIGVKLTGKTNAHSYGALYSNDQQSAVILPGAQSSTLAVIDEKADIGLARYQLDYRERDNIGGLVTQRQSSNYRNTVASFDGGNWLSSQDRINYQVAYSDTTNTQEIQNTNGLEKSQKGVAVQVGYSRETRHYGGYLGLKSVDKDFRADLGYIARTGYDKAAFGGEYRWFNDRNSAITKYVVSADVDIIYDESGNLLDREYALSANLEGNYNSYVEVEFESIKERYINDYYNPWQASIYATFRPISELKLNIYTYLGEEIDYDHQKLGDAIYVSPSFSWDINNHIQIKFDHNYRELRHSDILSFRANQSDVRFSYKFNINSIFKVTAQYTNLEVNSNPFTAGSDFSRSKRLATQFIYSYKINPQTLFYLGYSDGGFIERDSFSYKADNRSFFSKLSYAWQL